MDSEDFIELPNGVTIRITSIDAWVVMEQEDELDTRGEVVRSFPREVQVFIRGQDEPFKFTGDDVSRDVEVKLGHIVSVIRPSSE